VQCVQVLLVHNPSSGDDVVSGDELVERVRAAGHEPTYLTTDDDWAARIDHRTDLVVAAGGDGTVRDVLLTVGDDGPPTTALALGTANNLARTLGLPVDEPLGWVDGWGNATMVPFDISSAGGDERSRPFVESFGGGLFAAAMADALEKEPAADRLEDRLRLVQQTLADAPAHRWRVVLDGRDLSGDYLSVEALNIRSAGPGVLLAPHADPGDGLLDLVRIRPEDRGRIVDHIRAHVVDGEGADPLPIEAVQGRRLLVEVPAEAELRVDDELVDAPQGLAARHRFTVTAGVAHRRVLVPPRRSDEQGSTAGQAGGSVA
jgi:diacylglycerol kinase (ATP)